MFYIQLIGILAFCVVLLSFYKKNANTIIAYQVVSNFAYTVHYFLLGAFSGAFISLIGIFRNIFLLKFNKSKKIIAIIIITMYLLVTIIFYENFYSLFPMIANSQYLIAMIKGTKKSILIGALISSIMWLSYGIFVHSYASIITESMLLISNIIQLIKLTSEQRTIKNR